MQEQMLAEMKARQLQFEESQMEVQSEADEEAGPPEPEGQASLTRPPVARQSGMVSCGSLAGMRPLSCLIKKISENKIKYIK